MGSSLKISPSRNLCKEDHLTHLKIPTSKSHTMRALLLGALLPETSHIHFPLDSPDTDRLIRSLSSLGAEISLHGDTMMISGAFPWKPVDQPFDVGNSGIQLRFLTALLSLSPHRYQIEGDASLTMMRPVDDLLHGLSQLGATYSYLGAFGKAPFMIQGPIQSGKVTLKGGDSQPVSALLFALSWIGSGEIYVEDIQEIPWIKMTLGWLKRLGAEIKVSPDFRKYVIQKGIEKRAFDFSIPSDYSSLAYPFSISLITKVPLTFSVFEQVQDEGDAAFLDHVQESLGGHFQLDQGRLTPSCEWGWKTKSIDLSDCIDLVSLFAVLATGAPHEIEITGIQGARAKECDRLVAIQQELSKMNGNVSIVNDSLHIKPSQLKGSVVDSWDDHRMVFALSIAAMMAEGETIISRASCILKSYPSYVEQMQHLRFAWQWI